MVINQLLSVLLPSIIALKIDNNINTEIKPFYNQLSKYLTYVLFVNMFNYLITVYIFKQPNIVFTYIFTIKYIILSITISIILPILWTYIIKNITFNFKVKKNEKKN